jgi:hypothetical protein
MRRRIALVLASLVAVVAMACGGWLLDPAGSREGPAVATAKATGMPMGRGSAVVSVAQSRGCDEVVGVEFTENWISVDPKVDYAFKHVFGREQNRGLLIHLLHAVLHPVPHLQALLPGAGGVRG